MKRLTPNQPISSKTPLSTSTFRTIELNSTPLFLVTFKLQLSELFCILIMSVQDSANLPLHTEEVASSGCTMFEPPQQSSLLTQQTILPTRMVERPNSRASFLSLVPELRNEVYRYLLTLRDEIIDIRRPWESSELHSSIILHQSANLSRSCGDLLRRERFRG